MFAYASHFLCVIVSVAHAKFSAAQWRTCGCVSPKCNKLGPDSAVLTVFACWHLFLLHCSSHSICTVNKCWFFSENVVYFAVVQVSCAILSYWEGLPIKSSFVVAVTDYFVGLRCYSVCLCIKCVFW